ncbi:hypothetical protein BHE90_013834 [Fusarium euwallaceae]|uniref:C2H2-type domain-containing protein n=1 Tax=Fusarium euwallaceae TaxID=1147111 RepID=A0A430L7U0_9HYPO|nr:hypothetical protein BHE90_013834 [Fusarium euwallaceae]
MEETVESHARRCLQLFSKAVDASKASTDDPPAYFNRGVRDEQTRFKVWSGNIAAHRTGTGSLDHRLRDSSNIRNQVVNLLRDLSGLLEDAIAIFTGEETSWDQLSGDEDVVLGEDAEDSDSPDTELEQISIDVTDAVNCLLRLGVAIRDPAPHDRFVISDSADTSHYEQFDIQHVCSKFGSIDSGLAERLGKAITRRRQFFKYREDNRIGDGETAVSSLLEGKLGASQISGLPVPEDNCSDSEISQTSYASSTGDVEQRSVPPLPTEASEGPFECPFCYMMIAVGDESSWKSHVYRDLRPYVCLEKDCMRPDKEFSRRRQWMDHVKQNHWKVYPCPFSCQLTFTSNSECMEHVSQSHAGAGTLQELAAMISLSQQPLDIRSGISCPICGVNLNSAQQYQSHVGRHQEQLALFALPDLESDDEFDLYDDDLSDFESIEARSDNDLLSSYPNANTVRSDSFEADQNQHVPIEEPPSTSSALEIPDHPEVPNYGRRNEYFAPLDDIDQEVITTDICHHLGKDAVVRPGQYENPQTGQVTQGYYITSYRNLTTAMIEDLKAYSARWDSERRAQTSRQASRVQYRHSETYQSRYSHGPTEGLYQGPPDPRYPGTGAPGYTAAGGSYGLPVYSCPPIGSPPGATSSRHSDQNQFGEHPRNQRFPIPSNSGYLYYQTNSSQPSHRGQQDDPFPRPREPEPNNSQRRS